MRKKTEISQEDLNGLLGWFSPEADESARKYEEIRRGLIRYFYFRGAADPEDLADETINRVAVKLPKLKPDDQFKTAAYFYSFAAKIHLEACRERKRFFSDYQEIESLTDEWDDASDQRDDGVGCMEKCLGAKSAEDRQLLLKYYGFEKTERTERRRKLAQAQQTSIEGLQTRISRLRKALRECLKKCREGK